MKLFLKILSILSGIIVLGVILMMVLMCICVSQVGAAEPQSAAVNITELDCPADTVSFTDAIDLIRKVNSVIAVCDTVGYEQVIDLHTWQSWEDSAKVEYIDCPILRHRRLVGVTVVKPLGLQWFRDYEAEKRDSTGITFVVKRKFTEPGQAIIFFERRDE